MGHVNLAERTVEEWGLSDLSLGYGLDFEKAAQWGLCASSARNEHEPERFTEPALFVIRPDGTPWASFVHTTPFLRPPAKNLLRTLAWVIENEYLPRRSAWAYLHTGLACVKLVPE